MKFGKVLQQSILFSNDEWNSKWIDYKMLKGIVKDCADLSPSDKLNAEKLRIFQKENVSLDAIGMNIPR